MNWSRREGVSLGDLICFIGVHACGASAAPLSTPFIPNDVGGHLYFGFSGSEDERDTQLGALWFGSDHPCHNFPMLINGDMDSDMVTYRQMRALYRDQLRKLWQRQLPAEDRQRLSGLPREMPHYRFDVH